MPKMLADERQGENQSATSPPSEGDKDLPEDSLLCVVVGVVLNTVVFHGSEELDPQKPIQRHEEQEEDGHVVDLLTRPPEISTRTISLMKFR